ncbi:MAG: regulatory protein TetR [Frankiales bacterium]|nr:regulatory protein TetR [Frankiales bacterium]
MVGVARPPSFDRPTVLRAVENQFRKTGYAGTSLDDITAATGLGRGSLYAAFGDKHAMFMQAFEEYCGRNETAMVSALSGPDETAVLRLRDYLRGAVDFLIDDEQRLGCMAGKFAVELNGQDPLVNERICRDFTVLQEALISCVEGAQRHGDLDPEVPAPEIALLLLTISRGIDVISKCGRDPAELVAVADRAFACLPFLPGRAPSLTAPLTPLESS